MICITGDIHHGSLRTNDQQHIADPSDSEVKMAARFVRLVERHAVRATLYVTGKTLVEEWDDFRPIADCRLVELGGHGYGGLPTSTLEKLWSRLRGIRPSSHAAGHGSPRRQRADIERCVQIIGKRTSRPVVAWRSHGLVRAQHTNRLLAGCGVRTISDEIRAWQLLPRWTPEGLLSHPMNVLMDHDHLYHAHRDAAFVRSAQQRGYGADEFGSESYSIQEWGQIVRGQVARIEEQGGVATVLMHPICQFLADEFRTADGLLEFFAQYRTIWASELLTLAREHSW